MHYWLLKTEPATYSFDDLVREKRGRWDGVRNYTARNNLRAMQRGDLALIYHSGKLRAVVGVAKVVKTAYADPTAKGGEWSAVDVAPVVAIKKPVTLDAMRAKPALRNMILLRQGRLSVVPLTRTQFTTITKLGQGRS